MKTTDVWEMKNLKIVVPFDAYGAPTEDAAGMYGQILGQLACEPINLPITYADWRNVPKAWKDEIFDKEIKVQPNLCAILLIYLISLLLYTLTKVVFLIL